MLSFPGQERHTGAGPAKCHKDKSNYLHHLTDEERLRPLVFFSVKTRLGRILPNVHEYLKGRIKKMEPDFPW